MLRWVQPFRLFGQLCDFQAEASSVACLRNAFSSVAASCSARSSHAVTQDDDSFWSGRQAYRATATAASMEFEATRLDRLKRCNDLIVQTRRMGTACLTLNRGSTGNLLTTEVFLARRAARSLTLAALRLLVTAALLLGAVWDCRIDWTSRTPRAAPRDLLSPMPFVICAVGASIARAIQTASAGIVSVALSRLIRPQGQHDASIVAANTFVQLMKDLVRQTKECDADEDISAIIITGSQGVFSQGLDVGELATIKSYGQVRA
jgi:hypothetical protein